MLLESLFCYSSSWQVWVQWLSSSWQADSAVGLVSQRLTSIWKVQSLIPSWMPVDFSFSLSQNYIKLFVPTQSFHIMLNCSSTVYAVYVTNQ